MRRLTPGNVSTFAVIQILLNNAFRGRWAPNPPVFRISPPVNGCLLYAPKDFGDAVLRRGSHGSSARSAEIAREESVQPLLTQDSARSRKTLSLQFRLDEEIDVLDVVVTGDIVGAVAAADQVIVGGVQWRFERQGVASRCAAHPHPVFLRDDLALRTGVFSSFPRLDAGNQVPHALNPTRLRWGAVHIATGGDYRSS